MTAGVVRERQPDRTPAPVAVAVLYVAAVAVAVTLTGPLLLFNPAYVALEQRRHAVDERLGEPWPAVDAATGVILSDLMLGGDFSFTMPDGRQLLDDGERRHMRDVSNLVRTLLVVDAVALAVALISGHLLSGEARRRGRLLLLATASVGVAAAVLALLFAVAFDAAFLAFHELFFEEGTFLFGPGSDLLRLFPGGFWFDAALVAGAMIVVSAAALGLVGWRRSR
jgi:integral membrane protein (TIGR01906 family)